MEMTVVVKDENGAPIENADVYLNNKPIGKTPFAKAKVGYVVWKTYQIRVKKEGYIDTEVTSKRALHIAPLILGFFFWLPWLWVYGTAKVQTVTLKIDPKNIIRKCPSCGETIRPMQTQCEACGALAG